MPGGTSRDFIGTERTTAGASGYRGGLDWCLTCDVGWAKSSMYAVDKCWLCGSDENVWRWVPAKGGWQAEFNHVTNEPPRGSSVENSSTEAKDVPVVQHAGQ